jgi:hypothetical protein
MTVQERTEVVEHTIGEEGTLEIRLADASVRLKGVDGDVVRGQIDGDDVGELLSIDRRDGALTITSTDRHRGFGGLALALVALRSQGRYEVELEVPRRALVRVEIASGAVHGEGIVGRQRYRSASGDLDLSGAAGTIEMEAVSGGLRVSGPGPVKVRARTVSGDAELETGRIGGLDLSSASGDVRLRGAFDPEGEHRVSTISGDVELDLEGGVRVLATTMTGDITSDIPHRTGGGSGRRILEIGRGEASLFFKSVSGDLRIRSARPGGAPRPVDTARPVDAARPSDGPPPNMDRIAILQGVESGDITVEEASRWLALLDDDD